MRILTILWVGLLVNFNAQASIGLSAGAGVPYLAQGGIDIKSSNRFSYYLGYNLLDIDVGLASVSLSSPEFLIRYHIFQQAMFIGVGAGYQTLEATATDALTSLTATAEASGATGIVKLGWMWGASDSEGVWFGIDVAYILPLSSEVTITAPGVPTTDQIYVDAVEAGEEFGETAYPNVTFLRLGYLF